MHTTTILNGFSRFKDISWIWKGIMEQRKEWLTTEAGEVEKMLIQCALLWIQKLKIYLKIQISLMWIQRQKCVSVLLYLLFLSLYFLIVVAARL